jgi:hypothetical protein
MSTALSANERLIQSREQLRHALHQFSSPADSHRGERPEMLASGLVAKFKRTPGTGVLLYLFQNWWARQPLRVVLTLASETATAVLQPVAQRQPYGLVAGAAAVGAVLVLVRPWRWNCTLALLAEVLPKLVSVAVSTAPPPCQDTTKGP